MRYKRSKKCNYNEYSDKDAKYLVTIQHINAMIPAAPNPKLYHGNVSTYARIVQHGYGLIIWTRAAFCCYGFQLLEGCHWVNKPSMMETWAAKELLNTNFSGLFDAKHIWLLYFYSILILNTSRKIWNDHAFKCRDRCTDLKKGTNCSNVLLSFPAK